MDDNKRQGVICANKPPGPTSHDIVYKIKKLTGLKTGHTGTLDPAAEGVLPVCVGNATKIADYISASDKKYTVEILFGVETDTQDDTGSIILEKPLLASSETVRQAITSFKGDYWQVPPMFSALKRDGKKLYELAREGTEIKLEPRLVKIYDIELLEIDCPKRALISVRCSKGAYMRTLCRDIGVRLGSAARMGRLIRTEAGGFGIGEALTLEEIKLLAEENRLGEKIIPIDKVPAMSGLKKISVSEAAQKLLINGNRLSFSELVETACDFADGEKLLIYDYSGKLSGIYTALALESCVKPLVMLR